MKINENGNMYDGTHYVGEIKDNGNVYANNGDYAGEINSWGHIRDDKGKYVGHIDKYGTIKDADNRYAGKIDKDGVVYDRDGCRSNGMPLLNTDRPTDYDYGFPFFFKVIAFICFALGVATVGIYCWLQLTISVIVSVFALIMLCRWSFAKKGCKPSGARFISFLIIYIPTLIITLNEEFSSWFDGFLCYLGGFAIGFFLSMIVTKITVGICGLIMDKK